MLVEQMTCGVLVDENTARVAVSILATYVVQHAPARNNVGAVDVVFDDGNVAFGAVGRRGGCIR